MPSGSSTRYPLNAETAFGISVNLPAYAGYPDAQVGGLVVEPPVADGGLADKQGPLELAVVQLDQVRPRCGAACWWSLPAVCIKGTVDKAEVSYHGHGPGFAPKANEIGAVLGLPPVTVRNRGGTADLVCAHWPHNVRDPAHYLGAWQPRQPVPPTGDMCPHCRGTGRTP